MIWDIPPVDTFNLFSKIYEIPQKQYGETLNYIVNYMGIKELIDVPVRKLSLGQRMCCEIAASLLHNPEILFLDEPTIGLDILNKEKIREFIKKLNGEYKTSVILTTHDMGDVEKLCKRIVIIDKGAMIYDGSLENIKDEFGRTNTIKIEFIDKVNEFNPGNNDIQFSIDNSINSVFVKYDKRIHKTTHLISRIIQKYSNIKDVSIIETSIEDIVKGIYQREQQVEE